MTKEDDRKRRKEEREMKELCGPRRTKRMCTESKIAVRKEEKIRTKIREHFHIPLHYNVSRKKGRGIFSRCKIEKGRYVVEYSGRLLSHNEGLEKEEEYGKDNSIGSYLFFFEQYCIDATDENTVPKFGRLINHGDKNTANLKTNIIFVDGEPKVYFTATRDIPVGEELCYDYGERRAKQLEDNSWLQPVKKSRIQKK